MHTMIIAIRHIMNHNLTTVSW